MAPAARKKTKPRVRNDRDGLWKDAIKRFLPQLLQHTLPDLYRDVDWSQKPRFLSQELRDTLQRPITTKRNAAKFVDQLIQVKLKTGDVRQVLIHIEIQAAGGEAIAGRMMLYFSLIYGHYQQMPVGLVILTEPRPNEVMDRYENQMYGTRIAYEYNAFPVYAQDDEKLLNSDNPFDILIYVAKKEARLARGKRQDNVKRIEQKKYTYLRDITHLLAQKGWDEDDRRDILMLVARLIDLKDAKFRDKYLTEMQEDEEMAAMTFIERAFRNEGRKEGRVEGEDYGSIKTLWGLQKNGKLSLADAASEANLSVSAFKAKAKKLKLA